MSAYVPGSSDSTTGATPPSTASGSTPATTTSTSAPAVSSQQTTPGAATSVAGTTLMDIGLSSMLATSLGVVVHLIFSYGAAKLSYDKFGSIGWSILDFIFSWFYYPYYALFLNTPSSPQLSMIGARRGRK